MEATNHIEWVVSKAGDCMDVRDGTHDSPKYQNDGFPLVTSKNLSNGTIDFSNCSYISRQDYDAISKRSAVDVGDILYAMIGTIGNPAIVQDKRSFAIKNVALFKIDHKEISNRYIYYFLTSNYAQRQLNELSRGGTQKFVSLTNIRNLQIPLPSLKEQKKIVEILCAADSLRQKDKQLIEHYTALSQSLFLELFGDPVTNPMGWEYAKWEDVLEIKNGKSQKAVVDPNGKYPIYGSGGIMGRANDFICDAETVIIGRKGSINKPIWVREKFWNVDTAFGLCAKDGLEPIYLYYFCLRYNFLKHNKATTLPSLTKADLLKIEIPIPAVELQTKFSLDVEVIEQQKKHAQQSLAKSEELFNCLLQSAFKGDLTG